MKSLATILLFLLVPLILRAGPPLFTADYYLTNPAQWIGKPVTVSVSRLSPSGEKLPDGKRVISAETYNQKQDGGALDIVATPETAAKLITLCGTSTRHGSNGVLTTMIHGIFKEVEPKANPPRYFVEVEKQ